MKGRGRKQKAYYITFSPIKPKTETMVEHHENDSPQSGPQQADAILIDNDQNSSAVCLGASIISLSMKLTSLSSLDT